MIGSDLSISRYTPFDERVNLVEELDAHHDNIKKLLRLQLSPFSEEFLPVQAVLMGLPNYWQGQVITALNDDIGIIRITPRGAGSWPQESEAYWFSSTSRMSLTVSERRPSSAPMSR